MDVASVVSDFLQAERLLKIATPIGPDAFLMESFSGSEMVNGLFEFTATVRAKRDDVTAPDIVGKNVDVSLTLGDGGRRYWNGLVTGLTEEPRLTRGLRQYVLQLRPDLWLLSQKSDCRIWQNKTSVEVAETLLSEHGLRAPDSGNVLSAPPAQEYSVQWNETDLDYLLRRLQEDGIHYWIRQGKGEQVLVLADSGEGWDKGADGGEGLERYAGGSTDRNHITQWQRRFSFVPGSRAGRDWNFETPSMVPEGSTAAKVTLPRNGGYELYEYPARASDAAAHERTSRLRMQSVEADHEAIASESTVRTLAPGARLKPYDVAHPEHEFETAAVFSIRHQANDTTYETGSDEPSYSNSFTALPARLPATPHRETRPPRIDGSQIALIAGPEGEEIHTDQYGRVKLWFPWDRRAKKDGSDTKWVRVAQPWAGASWGAQVIPRIGMEAVVSFEGGDPDRPIVTALVPNPQQKVPYELPANKTRTTLRSNTHKGQGFNELSFEDDAGRENMFLHAQKDRTERVLNDRVKRIDRHEVASVGGNRAVEVASNQKTEIGGSMNVTVGGTGAGALGLMAQVAGMAGQTAGLLSQAAQLAGGAGGPGLGAFAGTLASSALGFLGGNGLSARDGVVAGASPRADAGTALAQSGSGVGEDASGLFPLPGIMNTVVGSFKSDTVGVARVEQIGLSKVTNVGQSQVVQVGKEQRTTVGETVHVDVGKLFRLLSREKFDGEAKVWEIRAEDRLLISAPGGYIELTREGIRIRGLKVDIEGNAINFSRGGPGEGAVCLREMAKTATPFVRG
jgi:type VI secretion system secreted protein VgrG